MNNSDIIAALSLAITAIVFLIQTDDGLLKLKFRKQEKWIVLTSIIIIILLVNHKVFERFNTTFYYSFHKFYLLPNEWALIIFLFLSISILTRIFSSKITNKDNNSIFRLIEEYRREKKWTKLQNLLLQVMDLNKFEKVYAERLNDTIFNDHHLIEHFASNFPELLIKFTSKHKLASINHGKHFFYILNGLFADKSNPIFYEIRAYRNNEEKRVFLEGYYSIKSHKNFHFDVNKNYKTELPIINWLNQIMKSFPDNLQEDTRYFINQYTQTKSELNNKRIFDGRGIERALSRDTLYNALRLFQILLVEFCFTNKQARIFIGSVLLLFYSTWDFIEESTELKSEQRVALNNDSYTLNEYFLKYLFEAYFSTLFLLSYINKSHTNQLDGNDDNSFWPLKQVFAKLSSLIGSNKISDRSKKYYISELIQIFFDLPEFFKDDQVNIEGMSNKLLWELKELLTPSPYGSSEIFSILFIQVCDSFDFYKYNTATNKNRAKYFYKYLLPYTETFEWKICSGSFN